MPRILDSQPELYRELLPAFFRGDVPAEAKATCASCAMCATTCGDAVEAIDGVSRLFRPDTKCCTYHPRLPNFLVGALLADPSAAMAEGNRRMRAKIAHRDGVTPQWVKAPAQYDLLYANARNAFGRSAALLCPFYERGSGGCSIWPYREAVCSTFFCKYVAGADGRTFWMSLKRYLSLVEAQLARYALLQLFPEYLWRYGDTPAASGTLSVSEVDGAPTPDALHEAVWGPWAGRELELYERSHALVRGLTAADLERLLGLDGDILQGIAAQRHADAVHPQLPASPRLNPSLTVKHLDDGGVALGFHSENDALALPRTGYDLLSEFKGRESLAAVRQRLRDVHGADFSDELLRELHHHRILI